MVQSYRGVSWIYLIILAFFLFFLYRELPSNTKPLPDSTTSNIPTPDSLILRPGDFVDPASHWDAHNALTEPESTLDEPDGPGTLHDLPENAFYIGGTRSLTTQDGGTSHPKPVIYDPYPVYNTPQWNEKGKWNFTTCRGPRGKDLDRSSSEDMVSVYRGTQNGFPHPMFGSHDAVGIDQNVCFDRYSRYGAYGIDEHNSYYKVDGFERPRKTNWGAVNWGALQSECYDRNADRYNPEQSSQYYTRHVLSEEPPQQPAPTGEVDGYKPRSAVILRASETMDWTPSHRQYLRSLIMELSLHTGGEYQVFFMIDVHNQSLPIESDEEIVEMIKRKAVPREFRNMTVLFNERILANWYPKLDEHRAIYQHLQPIQIFSQLYPEFDYFWQFEFDARLIGHSYHFLEQAINFAKRQPRKYLWERNAYFYTPGAHGTWDDFSAMVAKSMAGKKNSVWGAVPADGMTPAGPKPPVSSPEKDNFQWGVGEEADLITFLPIFNPQNTSWTFPWMMWNLSTTIPRRTSVITQWRISRRLLTKMHEAQLDHGMAFASEMSAPSWALLHGYKAVHVPQPIYVDGQWTPKEMARIFNQGPVENMNGEGDSIWNWDHRFDYLWYRISYMFATQTAEDMFRRWLGFRPEPDLVRDGVRTEYRPGRYWDDGGSLDELTNGRLCYPSMLLHTVKNTEPKKTPNWAVTDSALHDDAI